MKKKGIYRLVAVVLCVACSNSGEPEALAPVDFGRALVEDSSSFLLDVRKPEEFAQCRIPGATLLDVQDSTAFHEGLERLDKSRHYYLYCRGGVRSLKAACIMQERGFAVSHLNGGIKAWKEELLEVDSTATGTEGLE